jgi:UDP-N-acetylmuramoyl-tripeptide--D-alanyl-D-alanine ligase
MKKNMNKSKKLLFLMKVLRGMAFLVLKKYNPKIVSITGSVGKTSTKEAVFSVLAGKFRVRKNEKNYNNEIGVPLTIIGVESGKKSLGKWAKIFGKWFLLMIFPIEYPEILILEMGADHPGDIDYLTGFVDSKIGIITEIGPTHIEFFKSLEGIVKEKSILLKKLDEKALAIINVDNQHLAKLKNQLKSQVITFGFSEEATMRATDISFIYSENDLIEGISFKLNYGGSSVPVRLRNVLAKHQVYVALVAAAVGIEFGLNLVEISELLANFSSPCGRCKLIGGIKNSSIIDDTYNSSPSAALAAMEILQNIKAARRIVVMGDMLELGEETEADHREIGRKIFLDKIDLFFAFGKRMKFAVEELEKHAFPKENVFYFENQEALGRKLQETIKEGDLILVKGSQGMRMEKIVEEVMAEPMRAEDLLCRQSKDWKEKPFELV